MNIDETSQRESHFKGGIQKGMSATDVHAKALDLALKELPKEILSELKVTHNISYTKRISKSDLLSKGIEVGFVPDGGIWYRDNIPVAIFEAKKQGKGGNAIERWCKNYHLSRYLFPDARYITFGSREGFETDSYACRFARTQLKIEGNKNKLLNTLYSSGQSWFISPTGFTKEEIKTIMLDAILGNNLS